MMRELQEALAAAPAEVANAYYNAAAEVLKFHKDRFGKAINGAQTPLTEQATAPYFSMPEDNLPSFQNEATKLHSHRAILLQEALQITTKDRNAAYGNPEDNFSNIASYWVRYLTQAKAVDIVITPQDVAHMMILMKMARLATNPLHYDSLLDIAGYAACAADCQAAIRDA